MREAFEETFANPWFVFISMFFLIALSVALLLIYMPRMEEVLRLRRIIKAQHARIVELSEGSTRAEIDHKTKLDAMKGEYLSDIGELTSELAATQGRAAQNAHRADQIARAAQKGTAA